MNAFCLLLLLMGLLSANRTATLTIEIDGISDVKGQIRLGIYDNAAKFPKPDGQYRSEVVKVTGKKVVCQVQNLPTGDYAVALYHDVNNDNECNRNAIGYPKEPFAFSRNVKPIMSAPSFSETKVSVTGDTKINITLIH